MRPNGFDHPRRSPPIEPFEPVYLSQFEAVPVPERRWFIPGWIPMVRVAGLYGESTVGKTLLAQMLMTASALGRPWLGLKVHRGRTLGVFCEDDAAELHIRQAAINRHYGCDFADLELNMAALPRLGCNNFLVTFEDGLPQTTPFFEQLLTFAKDEGVESVFIDTLADCFGGNWNDAGQARFFIQALARIAREINGVVILSAHPSRAGARRDAGDGGSVQLDATMRARLLVERPTPDNGDDPDPYARILRLASSNYAPRDEKIELLWQDGVFVRQDPPATSTLQRAPRRPVTDGRNWDAEAEWIRRSIVDVEIGKLAEALGAVVAGERARYRAELEALTQRVAELERKARKAHKPAAEIRRVA